MATITAAPFAPCSAVAVRFSHGLPGLEEYRTFTLIGVDDLPVYLLQCEEEPSVVLPVAEAFAVAADYEFDISDADADDLALDRPEDARILVVLVVSEDATTANLMAPIVVNRDTGAAKQVVLEGTAYALRHPVGSFRV